MITWSIGITTFDTTTTTTSRSGAAFERADAIDEARAAAHELLDQHTASTGGRGLAHLSITIDDQVVAVVSTGDAPGTPDILQAHQDLDELRIDA